MVLSAYPVMVGGVVLLTWVLPQGRGPLALAQIFLPHLVLLAAPLVVAAALLRHRVLAVSLVVLALLGVGRFGPEWVSLPAPDAAGTRLSVITWNLLAGSRTPDEMIDALLSRHADVVALQELTPDIAAALETNPRVTQRYPFQVLAPDSSVLGVGLLSAHPVTDSEVFTDPVGIEARIELGGEMVGVVTAHPLPGNIGRTLRLPISIDGRRRDAEINGVADRVERLMAGGHRVIVLGDFNATPYEPGYARLAAGMRDVHAEVGMGPGWTWRGNAFQLPIPIIRIDLILVSPTIQPVASRVDCRPSGDHCLVLGEVVVTGDPG